jgi:hypothetical protein
MWLAIYRSSGRHGAGPTQKANRMNTIKTNWISDALATGTRTETPVAVVMMGGPGSGKSSALRGLTLTGFVAVDPDAVKAALPLYQELVACGNPEAAAICHAESSKIAASIRDAAIAGGYNVLIDGTGKNLAKMTGIVETLNGAGYETHIVYVEVSLEIGLSRATACAALIGRVVPVSIIEAAYTAIPANFEILKDMVTGAHRFNNEGTAPVLVSSTGTAMTAIAA